MFDGETSPPAPFDFDVATAATKGARDYQEDSLLSNFAMGQGYGFAIIADGLGGHVEGHLASALATTEVYTHLKMLEQQLDTGKLNVPFALQQAANAANRKIADHVKRNSETEGMGTTLLAPVVRGDRLSWISIGDSPLYLLRNGALRQINKDHSMAPQIDMMVTAGSMAREIGKTHPDRNTLTSVINGDKIEHVDCPTSTIQLKDGDMIVASSDGLQSLPTEVMVQTMLKGAAQGSMDVVKRLVGEIEKLNAPDQDNASFIVIRAVAKPVVNEDMDLDSMPILASAESDVPAPQAAAAPEEPKKERKVRWYRGQKYYDD